MMFHTFSIIFCVCFVAIFGNAESTNTNTNQSGDNDYYEYIPKTKAAYKFHRTVALFEDAKSTCEDEGASLFFPKTELEWNAVIPFFQNKYKESLPSEMLLGLQNSGNGFQSIDGDTISKVYVKWNPNEPNNPGVENCVIFLNPGMTMNNVPCSIKYAFICKSQTYAWNEQCQTADVDYVYNEETGKCYKMHLTPKTWREAQDKCRAEHSQLAVINSHEEAAYIVRLTRKTLRSIPNKFTHGIVLLGFHNNNVDDWQTVEGTSLYYSGYACWGNSQPDGGESDRCGSMFYNGHLNDIACDKKAFFICEHDNVALDYVREPRSFYNVIQSVQCHDTI